jgi:hypothetical protein
MPVSNLDVGNVVNILATHHHRVRYGVLGAAISNRAGNLTALPEHYAQATVTMLNAFFGGRCPAASWVVDETGFPTGYGAPPNPSYDTAWNANTPLHDDVQAFLAWLDATAPGWDAHLHSTFP